MEGTSRADVLVDNVELFEWFQHRALKLSYRDKVRGDMYMTVIFSPFDYFQRTAASKGAYQIRVSALQGRHT